MTKSEYTKLTGLIEKKNESTGETYLFGRLGDCSVFVFKNKNKCKKDQADFNLVIKSFGKY